MGLNQDLTETPDNHAARRDANNAMQERFLIDVRNLSDDEVNWMVTFSQDYAALAKRLNFVVKDSREKALALTKLEESFLWAKQAIQKFNETV